MTSGIKLMSKNKTANVTSSQKQVVAIIAMKYYQSSKSRAVVLLVVFVTTQGECVALVIVQVKFRIINQQ